MKPTQPHKPQAPSKTPAPAREENEKTDLAPPGSRDYVAGQPVDEEEQAKTEAEAERLKKAGDEQRRTEEEARQPKK